MNRSIIPILLPLAILGLAPVASTSAALMAQLPMPPERAVEMNPAPRQKKNVAVMPDGTPRTDFKAHPATQDPKHLVTLADLKRWEKELSNWTRWPNPRGTLNYITRAKTKGAASLIRSGIAVSMSHSVGDNHFLHTVDTENNAPTSRFFQRYGADGAPQASEAISYGNHDGQNSHLDAFCGYWGGEKSVSARTPGERRVGFQGYPYLVTERGCEYNSIEQLGNHYMTRGVLYDIPLLRDLAYLDPTTPIFVEDLEEFERYSGVKAGEGDVLVVRAGRWALREAEGPWNYGAGAAGLHASTMPWLFARHVAMVVGDGPDEVQPSGVAGINRPYHQITHAVMGLAAVDNADLERVARVARGLKRWEFMVAWSNLYIPFGSATMWNGLATF